MKRMVERLSAVSLSVCFIVALCPVASARQLSPDRRREQITAAEALRRYEERLQTITEPVLRLYLTTKLAPTALAAGETEKAKAYANSLLQQAANHDCHCNYGDAIHVGNLVLGQIALAADDLPEAKRLLLEAGKSPGSPPLNSFGPNMLLAKDLLARGEREVVIQYFALCARFWELDRGRLEKWKAIVINGGTPNFGANLVYLLSTWQVEDWANPRWR
jgi:hypothetical protein